MEHRGNGNYGFPRSDAERAERHYDLYGETELPPRGTGLIGGNTMNGLPSWMPDWMQNNAAPAIAGIAVLLLALT